LFAFDFLSPSSESCRRELQGEGSNDEGKKLAQSLARTFERKAQVKSIFVVVRKLFIQSSKQSKEKKVPKDVWNSLKGIYRVEKKRKAKR
jgi:1,2-phenylacetyl-CoA epoxidase PaaB subunit